MGNEEYEATKKRLTTSPVGLYMIIYHVELRGKGQMAVSPVSHNLDLDGAKAAYQDRDPIETALMFVVPQKHRHPEGDTNKCDECVADITTYAKAVSASRGAEAYISDNRRLATENPEQDEAFKEELREGIQATAMRELIKEKIKDSLRDLTVPDEDFLEED